MGRPEMGQNFEPKPTVEGLRGITTFVQWKFGPLPLEQPADRRWIEGFAMKTLFWKTSALVAAVTLTLTAATSAEPLPLTVKGAWHITRIIPTRNPGCWTSDDAQKMLGTTLVYKPTVMTWRDGDVDLSDITTRTVTADEFAKENGEAVDFAQLGIKASRVLEVDMQHEDMNITGATTEVPGDSVLVVSPSRIIVSACGVYFEATRGAGGVMRASVSGKRTTGE